MGSNYIMNRIVVGAVVGTLVCLIVLSIGVGGIGRSNRLVKIQALAVLVPINVWSWISTDVTPQSQLLA